MIGKSALDDLCALVEARLGHYRQDAWRNAILSELQHRKWPSDETGLALLLRELTDAPIAAPGWQALLHRIAIGETRFLRDKLWFGQIEQRILIPLIQQRRAQGVKHIRCWSAGCSTGEEAYTLAMLLHDLLPDLSEWSITIFATDARQQALDAAAAARYERRQLRELHPSQIQRHFIANTDGSMAIAPALRRLVRLAQVNLADDAELPAAAHGQDLIICRNVLMYMAPERQKEIGRNLAACLVQDGWLAVSPAEAVAEWYAPLRPVNTQDAILFQKRSAEPEAAFDAGLAAKPMPPSMPATVWPTNEIKAAPEKREPDLLRLRRMADTGYSAEAAAECRRLLAASPLNGQLCLLFAEICLERHDWQTAREVAARATRLMPASALAHFYLANALWRGGQTEQARGSMTAALDLANASQAEMPVLPFSEITIGDIRYAARIFLGHEPAAGRRVYG